MEPAAGYPSLSTVPPRPQLSYPFEQRRAVVESLVADLENARYTRQVVQFRAGQTDLPPPPAPPALPADVATAILGPDRVPPTTPMPPAAAPTAVIDTAPLYGGDDDDDGSLSDFVRQLERETAPAPPPGIAVPEPPPTSEPAAPEAGPVEPPAAEREARALGAPISALPVAYDVPPDPPIGGAAPADMAWRDPASRDGGNGRATAQASAAAPPRTYDVPPDPPIDSDPATSGVSTTDGRTIIEAALPHEHARSRPGGAALVAPTAPARAGTVPVPQARPAPAVAVTRIPMPEPRPRTASTEVAPAAATDSRATPPDAVAAQVQARLVAFRPGSSDLSVTAEPELARLLADAERAGLVIDIIGEAKDPVLALARARSVALALIKLGAGTDRVRIGADPEPSGDRAWIILADPL